jgi:RHS repeat-associated protein
VLFAGAHWDADLGLYYVRHRWYDPYLGRFVSRDPIGMWGDGLNLGNGQAYVGHNPWSWVDPYGLKSWWCRGILDAGLWKAAVPGLRPSYPTVGTSTPSNAQITGGIDALTTAASEYGEWTAETGLLAAALVLPGPEDGVFLVLQGGKALRAAPKALAEHLRKQGKSLDDLMGAGKPGPGGVPTHRIGADLLKRSAVLKYLEDLGLQGGKVVMGSSELAKKNAAGSYNAATDTIHLHNRATRYEVFHEAMHRRHRHEIGIEAYSKLSEFQREEYVYKKIIESRDLWSRDELAHAGGYISQVRARCPK